jgi:hypothetical protein
MVTSYVMNRCLLLVFVCGTPLGCASSSEPAFEYDEAQMQQIAVGTWSGKWVTERLDAGPGDDGGTTNSMPFTLVLQRSTATGARPLCSSRKFADHQAAGPSASLRPLCVSTSEMSLVGRLTVSDGSFTDLELPGTLVVPGLRLNEANLNLRNQTADVSITAQWNLTGWKYCRAVRANRDFVAECAPLSRGP